MSEIRNLIKRYLSVPHSIKLLITGAFMLQLLNASAMLIMNIYLSKLGYVDSQIADFVSYRFISILLFSIPFGLIIKGKRLKPFFITGAIIVPLSGVALLFAANAHIGWLIKILFFTSSLGFMLEHVTALPFILRHGNDDTLSESIALNFAVWSLATIVAGFLIKIVFTLVAKIGLSEFGEFEILLGVSLISILSLIPFSAIKEKKPSPSNHENVFQHLKSYNWNKIFKGLLPMFLISIGAGLTIPFMNLYFHSVFKMDSDTFALMGSIAAIIVFIGGLLTPILRRKLGYGMSIAVTQFSAIFFLICLASTELYSHMSFALWFAGGAFIIRQPLMNMASPITSELVMKYVGENNRELISAIETGLWNASWFVSAKIFQFLRGLDLPYYKIFIITAILYSFGTITYLLLVKDYKRKVARRD
ncbi:MAG: MFS transporter [Candidatus Marinimicrobia bacterium]|nr:MFS transporter [Candidatus Neomarinimicrobiota bacterium]